MIATLFENAPCGYFAFDENAITLVVNDTLASILEKPKEDIVGTNVETFLTLPTRIFFQTHFFPLIKMQGHAEEIFILLLTAKGKHLPVLMNAKTMDWDGKAVTCCSCILVPNRKKFEDDLVAARNTAEKALKENSELLKAESELQQRTEQLDKQIQLVQMQNHELQQFSHVVTHNLKEPLRKILMYTGKLMQETTAPSLATLVRASEQMKAVITGLQQYVWLNEKTNDYTQVNLNHLIEEITKRLTLEHPDVQISIKLTPLPTILGDKEQSKVMLEHLLSNAVKFRKEQATQVTIEGTVIKQNRFRSVENKYQYQDFLRMEIVDQGVGFDPLYSNQIFELFRKLHSIEGQGLGLALCKKIAENHQGHIEAESVLYKFTKITVWLPYFQPAPEKL